MNMDINIRIRCILSLRITTVVVVFLCIRVAILVAALFVVRIAATIQVECRAAVVLFPLTCLI
jgi:hypothetical protein